MDELAASLNGFVPLGRDILDLSEPEASLPAEQPRAASGYSQAIAEAICERVSQGEPVRKICRDEGMPSRATVYRWLLDNEDFQAAYAMAMQCRIDDMADECLEIADDASRDMTLDETGDVPVMVLDKEHVARTKLRLAERHWWLACISPRKYGRTPDLSESPSSAASYVAKEVNPKENLPTVIDEHPLGAALRAWEKMGTAG